MKPVVPKPFSSASFEKCVHVPNRCIAVIIYVACWTGHAVSLDTCMATFANLVHICLHSHFSFLTIGHACALLLYRVRLSPPPLFGIRCQCLMLLHKQVWLWLWMDSNCEWSKHFLNHFAHARWYASHAWALNLCSWLFFYRVFFMCWQCCCIFNFNGQRTYTRLIHCGIETQYRCGCISSQCLRWTWGWNSNETCILLAHWKINQMLFFSLRWTCHGQLKVNAIFRQLAGLKTNMGHVYLMGMCDEEGCLLSVLSVPSITW